MSPTQQIRPAVPADVPRLLELVQELAEYEREPDAVQTTEQDLLEHLFPADPAQARVHALVAEVDDGSGPRVEGMAIWYVTFSTWVGRHGLWLEDLYVTPDRRGSGLGKALLQELARIAVERGYGRVEWWVLDWNEPSIAFYRRLGAVAQDEWTTFRLDGDALSALGTR
ncbi:GNAT family N-acetyltransferase [Angustibacter aerolatus]